MIEIIPKPAQKLPLWLNILFYFSIGLLLATILTYFILGRSLKKSDISLKNLEETISHQEKTSEEISLEREVSDYQKKIKDFSLLFFQHRYCSKFFDFIEKNCHPKIWFSQFSLNSKQAEANLSGEAENFTVIGQQFLIFKSSPLVKNINLAQISIGRAGRVNFSLDLSLDPSVFKPH